MDHSDARARVTGWLDEINPRWRTYVAVEPGLNSFVVILLLMATFGVWLIGVAAILAGIAYLIYRAA